MNELLNYYVYDQKTKAYLNSGVAETEADIPQNATTLPPIVKLTETTARDMINPYWDEVSEKWIEHDPQKLVQETVMQQSQQITLLQTMTMQQNQENVKLQANNQQQATQIKQLQQMFMQVNQQQAIEKSKEVAAQ